MRESFEFYSYLFACIVEDRILLTLRGTYTICISSFVVIYIKIGGGNRRWDLNTAPFEIGSTNWNERGDPSCILESQYKTVSNSQYRAVGAYL